MDSQVRLMEAEIVPPESFVAVDHRLFIDTNVFMDTDPVRSVGLKKLFERCKDAAIGNANGIVVPSKVIDELIRKSGLDTSAFPVNGGVKPGHCGGARVGQFGSVSLLGEGARRHGARAHHGAGACHGAWPSGQGS